MDRFIGNKWEKTFAVGGKYKDPREYARAAGFRLGQALPLAGGPPVWRKASAGVLLVRSFTPLFETTEILTLGK